MTPNSASLIGEETFEAAPLTAPLYSGELPKAEGFFLPKFHTRAAMNLAQVSGPICGSTFC